MRFFRFCFFLFTLTWVALAAPEKNPIPEPELMVEADSFSIAVVSLRENDEAIKSLLEAALKSISSGETKLPASMADVSDYLSRNNRADLLFAGLPFQGVRVDRMLPSNKTSPFYAMTLAGWKGLQVNVYNSLCAGSGGAYPSARYRVTDLVSRDHADDPSWAGTLYKVNGSFLFSPSAEHAKKTVDKLVPKDRSKAPTAENGALLAAYRALPKTADAYGIALNQKGAFSALLKSLNNEHIQKLRDKVGNDRLEAAVANTKSATWKVEIISSERAEFEVVLDVDPAKTAEVVATIEDGKGALDTSKVTDITVTQTPGNVTARCAVVNLKNLMLESMTKAGK